MRFQYISCYCLSSGPLVCTSNNNISIHLMLLFITPSPRILSNRWYFNTSHVTVYLEQPSSSSILPPFQYISCYCLSLLRILKIGHTGGISIHLMLLFIAFVASVASFVFDFNTSHVTVYLLGGRICPRLACISIHLMLLFIFFWRQPELCH